MNFINNYNQAQCNYVFDNNKIIKNKRRPKEKVVLSPKAEKFMKRVYTFLSNGEKKVVRKELIFKCHEMIRQNHHSLRCILREEYRSIKKYFIAFVDQEVLIMKGLNELKEQGKLNTNSYIIYPITFIRFY